MLRCCRLSEDAHRLLVRSLCNVLLLSWPGLQEQKWEDRKKHLGKRLVRKMPGIINLVFLNAVNLFCMVTRSWSRSGIGSGTVPALVIPL